jgi:hypothetical protein
MPLNTKIESGMNYDACIVKIQNGSIRIKSPSLKEIVRQSGDNNFIDTDGMLTIKQDRIAPFFEAIVGEHLDDTMLTSILNMLTMDYTIEHIRTIESSEKVSTFVEHVTKETIEHLGWYMSIRTNNQIQNSIYHYALNHVAAIIHGKTFTTKTKFKMIGETPTSFIVSYKYYLPDVPNISVGSQIEFEIIPSIIRYPEIENAESSNKLMFDIIDVIEEEWHNVTIDMNNVRDFSTWCKVIESFTPYTLKPLSDEQKSEFQRMISHKILAKAYHTPVMT